MEGENSMKVCACDPGYFLCPEAVRLWDEVGIAYRSGDPKLYFVVLDKYFAHKKEVENRLEEAKL